MKAIQVLRAAEWLAEVAGMAGAIYILASLTGCAVVQSEPAATIEDPCEPYAIAYARQYCEFHGCDSSDPETLDGTWSEPVYLMELEHCQAFDCAQYAADYSDDPSVRRNVQTVCEASAMVGPFNSWETAEEEIAIMTTAPGFELCKRTPFVQTPDDIPPFYIVCPQTEESPLTGEL